MPYGWISSSLSNDGLIENLRVNVGLSEKVVSSMKRVDRANYCRGGHDAYYDSPQSIGLGQTISAPHGNEVIIQLNELCA
jgi:protein-L-isoaspartate O-methyltransferase